jgi:hypothetical protein
MAIAMMVDSSPAMQLEVDLGPMPVDSLSGGAIEGGGLRGLLERKEFCDVLLEVGGQSFAAHSMVLAAVSPSFCLQIQEEKAKEVSGMVVGVDRQPLVIHLSSVSHPEAVQDLISCIYGALSHTEAACKTETAHRDAIRLAQTFQIPQLQEQSSWWLARNLTTHNVLARLAICEEFGLLEVREKILENLIADPVALPMLVRDPEITKVPKVLQDLLVRILTLLGAGVDASVQHGNSIQAKPQGKQTRKAGA